MDGGRNKLYIIIAIICFVLCGIYYVSLRLRTEKVPVASAVPPVVEAAMESPAPEPAPAPLVKVHVAGAVVSPGVYALPKGSRAEDAVALAGGFTADADTASVNLAAVVQDGQQLIIRVMGEAGGASARVKDNPLASGAKINLNTAPQEELMLLPGIGETLAGAILRYREENGGFETIQELMNVPKIGEKTFANLETFITVE